MKAAPFEYHRAASIEEACALLAADGEARLIAGGQTLIPMMALRLARPTRLIDIMRVPGLSGIRQDGAAIRIGATTRQVEVERSSLVAARLPLLAAAMPWVGHAPTRSRGTVGGSVANADPAAEIALVLATLGGSVVLRDGARIETVAAKDFFVGPMTTAAAATACLVEVTLPLWSEPRTGAGFAEIASRRSDFAYAAAAAQLALDADGKCTRCVVGIGGATPVPTVLELAGKALTGRHPDAGSITQAVAEATAGLECMNDAHASPAYRRRAAAALAVKAITQARDNALGTPS